MGYEEIHSEHGEADQIRLLKGNKQIVGQGYDFIIYNI